MRPTMYFNNAVEMAAFAKEFAKEQPNWFLRTTLTCNHLPFEKRKAIVLISKEKLVRSLIVCKTCNPKKDGHGSNNK